MYKSVKELIHKSTLKYAQMPAFSLKTGFRTKTYTYKEVYSYITKFSSFFETNNIKRGEKIVILSPNRPEYAVTIMGAMIAGVTIVPIDYRTNHETILKFIKLTNPKAIFASLFYKELFHGVHEKLFLFEELLAEVEKSEPKYVDQPPHDHLAAILFTSGTTGEPKGTMITYENIVASINNIRTVFILPPQTRLLSILPLSHALEMFGGLMTSFSYGSHIHYLERINSITIIQALRRYHIQGMAVVPQMLRLLLQNIERHIKVEKKEEVWKKSHSIAPYLPMFLRKQLFRPVHDSLGGSFSFFACGSAPLDVKIAEEWMRMGVEIVEGYGASETTGFISTNTLQHKKIGTVGRILQGIEYKKSETGELYVKGKNVVSGYFDNPEKTKEAFPDGWFNTGDIVQFDSSGYIKIVGRDKFKIVLPDGKKVYPEDVEKKLNNNPLVADSTVFGLDLGEGEIVHAEIITSNPHKLTQVVDEVNKTLNPHEQILDYGRWLHDDFPRTKTLKVDREAVRTEVKERKSGIKVTEDHERENNDKVLRILSTVSGKKHVSMHGNATLATDLKLDSLKRIELLALIEEEMGVSVDELKITSQTTISDLRTLIEHGKPTVVDDKIRIPQWQFTRTTDNMRVALQDVVAFPLLNSWIKVNLKNPENLKKIKTPQLFIFNHVGVYDVVTSILRILPREIRKKTAIAATNLIWQESDIKGIMAGLFANCIPFVRAEEHEAMRGNFERVGQVLDNGYNIAISPEGNITHTGKLLPFHTGAGYIAIEMGVPVTPFKMNGYYELWPEEAKRTSQLFWPKKPGSVEVIVGEPITFPPSTSYEEATEILRKTMLDLS